MAWASSLMSAVGEAAAVGLAVEDLQGGDLVLVVLDELAERLGLGAGPVGGLAGVLAGDHLVLGRGVDHLLVAAADVDQLLSQLGVAGDGLHRLGDQALGGTGQLLGGRVVGSGLGGGFGVMAVGG